MSADRPPRKPPLSNAERQARYRARQHARAKGVVVRHRRPVDRRSRPQRWRDAVTELLAQADYAAWADTLRDALRDTPTTNALQAIVALDLDELAVEPPRRYGRD